MSDGLAQREAANLDRLTHSDLLNDWIDQHPDGWDHREWLELIDAADQAGFMPVAVNDLGDLLKRIHQQRFNPEPRRVRRSAASVDDTQTLTGLATAVWTDPLDFADRRGFDPGDFWLGRCPLSGKPLGYKDDAHIWINAGTGGGKGATVVIPNHLLWQGSLVSIDPKGTNATVTSARRGDGNDVCVGMGQNVAVLDPMGCATVEDKYRKRFNPLDALDPNEVKFVEKASALANAIVIRPEDEKDPFWNNSSHSLLKGIILHVKTAPEFDGRRTMKTVYQLCKGGDKEGAMYFNQLNREADAAALKEWETKQAGERPKPSPASDAFDVLFRMMKKNHACDEVISDVADEMMELRRNKAGNQWGGFRSSLARHIEFMESKGLQACMETSDFKLSDLKHHPAGTSLFLSLPLDDMETYNRWLRMMVTLIFYELRSDTAPMATGHRLLMCLDEFATLGYLKEIETGFSTLREYDVKLMIVTQFLQQVTKPYEKSWHGFLSNTSLRVFFGLDEETAKEVSTWIGEAEIVLNTESTSLTANQNTGTAIAAGRTRSEGGSHGETNSHTTGTARAEGTTQSIAEGKTSSIAKGDTTSSADGVTRSRAIGEGVTDTVGDGGSQSQGGSRGSNQNTNTGSNESFEGNYGLNWLHKLTGAFRSGERIGKSDGSSQGTSASASWNDGQSWQRSQARNRSNTNTDGVSRTLTKGSSFTKTGGTSRTTTAGTSSTLTASNSDTRGTTNTKQWSDGESLNITRNTSEGHGVNVTVNQTIQKRPLMFAHDLRRVFGKLEEDDLHFPGLSLVLIGNEHPVIVQRTLYYDDVGFDGLYDRHPRYPQTDPPPLLRTGTVIVRLPATDNGDKPDGFWCQASPNEPEHGPMLAVWHKRPGEKLRKGEVLYAIKPGLSRAFGFDNTLPIHATFSGTVQTLRIQTGTELEPDRVIAEVEFYLPDLWAEEVNPANDGEFDRFVDGTHPLHERRRQIIAERERLAQVERDRLAQAEQDAKPAAVVPAPTIEPPRPTFDRSRYWREEKEFKAYRWWLPVAIPAAIAIFFSIVTTGLLLDAKNAENPAEVDYTNTPPYPTAPGPAPISPSYPTPPHTFDAYQKELVEHRKAVAEYNAAVANRPALIEAYQKRLTAAEQQYEVDLANYYTKTRRPGTLLLFWAVGLASLFGMAILLEKLRHDFLYKAWARRNTDDPNYSAEWAARRARYFKNDPPGLRVIRRVIWAVNEGEIVGWNKQVVPFDPLATPKH